MDYYSESNFYPESSIGYLVRRINQLGTVLLDPIFAQHGISSSQWSAIVLIYLERATTCAAIARELGHDKGAMTRLIDDLEAKNLVTRERDSDDRRIVNITLTAEGETLGLECKRNVVAAWNRWLADWGADDIDMLVAKLSRLKTRLDTLAELEPVE